MTTLALILVSALAANRAARAIALDTISARFRDRLQLWAYSIRQDRNGKLRGNFWRAKLHGLLTCPHCCGAWLSWLTTAIVLFATGQWREQPIIVSMVECWAVAGIQDFIVSVQVRADASAALSAQTEKLVRNELQRRNARTDAP